MSFPITASGKDAAGSLLTPELASALKQSQLPSLDALRAIAALLVVVYHFGIPFVSGGLGVLMFFVLSGFLITWLLLRENAECGAISLSRFYVRRSLRIFPAFYCYCAVLFAVVLFRHSRIVLPQTLSALFYVNNYYQALKGDPNTGFSHTWSLAIEEQFYLLWPMTFLLLRRDYQRMSRTLAFMILAVWIYRVALVWVFKVHEGYVYEALDTRADHLLIGCLLAVMLRAGFFPRFWNWIATRLGAAAVVMALLAASSFAEMTWGPGYRDRVGAIANPLLTAIWISQLLAMRASWLLRWAGWAWVRYLGRISYSVYLYQQLLVDVPKKWLHNYGTAVQLAASVALIIVVASASYFFVERPLLKLKMRFKRTEAGAAP